MIRKGIALIVMLLFIGMIISPSSSTKQVFDTNNSISQNLNYNITNLTVQEAYDFLTDTTCNQVPIDIRTIGEWRAERIDTPFPEHPRNYPSELIQNHTIMPKFLWQYEGCEIILYGNDNEYRIWKTAINIDRAGFNGKIYNMFGGLKEWKNKGLPTAPGGIYNITVNETMLLLSDTYNGKQTPIDIRSKKEWYNGFIDTPWPECPIHHEGPFGIEFMLEHIGKEVILYDGGGYRSLIINYELYINNFTATQYNIMGGITEWKKYHPIRNNTEPDAPTITGPSIKVKADPVIKPGTYNYTFTTVDPEDDVVCYFIDWGDNSTEWTDFFFSGEEVIIEHTWSFRGVYNVSAFAKDFYGNESEWGVLYIPVSKSKNTIFQYWLERFPLLQKILDVLRLNIGLESDY